MKSFYSILYIKPEAISDEKISVGLFMNTDNRPIFDYSEEKLKIAGNLFDTDIVISLSKLFRNIKKKTDSISKDKNQLEAFDVIPFTESYFKYLNSYSNNLLFYSDPSENIGDFKRNDFRELFRLLVDRNYGEETKVEKTFKSTVRDRINSSSVKDKMDVFYKVSKNTVKTIYRDHEVDYIGVNGSIISGNSVDLKKDPYNLENKFYLLKELANGLINLASELKMKNEGKHIVFHNDPEGKKNKDLLYDAIHDDTNKLTFKHWDEFNTEEKWIAETPLKKFSELDL
ncbi:MAG TPA: hypothetical protein VKA34_00255 [Balneolales bacterium]|nr:hypothetical protein [Balneolales bacterium]